jgi:hypothetical protein
MKTAAGAINDSPIGPIWRKAVEFRERRDVAIVLLGLVALLAAGVFIRDMHELYQGDAHIYWAAIRSPEPYVTAASDGPEGYLYAPVFIQAIWPILSLPWAWFYAIWLALGLMTLIWLLRPVLTIAVLPFVFITFGVSLLAIPRHSLSSMNVTMFMGIAVAAGFRWPWTWSLLILTKVTPGLGLLWFMVRREWQNLIVALGFTAAVVAVSFVISPNWWFDWATVIQNNSRYPEPAFAIHFLPLIPRLIIAAVMIAVAARADARWVMPIAVVLAMPYVADTSLIVLAAVPPLLRHDAWTEVGRPRPADPAVPATTAASPA